MTVRLCAVVALALVCVPGFALDNPLGVFSKETSLIVRSSSPAAISAKAKAFLEQAAPRFAPVADQIGPAMGSMIQNPTLEGIDAERDWYLAVTFQAEDQPRLVFAIPAKDIEALKSALGEGIASRTYEDWLVYSTEQEAVEGLPEAPLSEEESIQAAMDEAVAKMFASGELSLFVNVPAVRAVYQTQIEEFQKQVEEAPAPDDPQAVAGMEFGKKMLKVVLDVLGASTGMAMNVALREDAIVGEAVFIVDPESETAKFLAKQKPSELPLLGKLPAGSMAYYDIAGGLNELVNLSFEMFTKLPTSDEQTQAAMEKLSSYDYQESAMALDIGGGEQGGAIRGVTLTRLGSTEGYLEAMRAWAKAATHLESRGFQQDITWQPAAETIAGVKVDVSRTVMTIGPEADPGGNLNRMMKLFWGEDGLTQRVAVVDNFVVQSVGGGQEQAEAAIQAAQGEAGGDTAASLNDLRKELGGTGQMILVYDLPRIAAAFLSVMIDSGMAPLPPNTAAAIEELELAPSYGGALMSIEEHRVRFREIIPAAQIKGLVDLGTALQQAGQGN